MGRWFSSYPLLRNISGVLFILLLLQTTAVSLLIYTVFSNQITAEKYNSFVEGASLADSATESFFSEVSRLSAYVATNEASVTAAMFRSEENPVADFTAVTRLSGLQLSYDYISYSALYRQSDDKLRATIGINRDSLREIKDFVRNNYERGKPIKFFAADVEAVDQRGSPVVYPTVTFAAYSNLSGKGRVGAVLIGVDTSYFQRLYAGVESARYAPFALMDDAGHVFSMPDKAVYQNEGIYAKIKEQDRPNGYFTEWVDGSQYIISYSRNANLGCILFQAVPYDVVFADLFKMQLKVFLWTVLFLCIGTISSYFLAYRLLLPLYGLLRKYNYRPCAKGGSEVTFLDNEFVRLTAGAEKSRVLMCHNALYDLLLNQSVNETPEDILKDISALPFCMVVLLSVDREASVKAVSVEEASAVRYAVCDITAKILKKNFKRVDSVIMNSADVAVILFLEDGRTPEKLRNALLESEETVYKIYSAHVFCAVSSVVGSIYELNESYTEAVSLMERNFLCGKPIIFSDDTLPPLADVLFPVTIEKELFAAVSSMKQERIDALLRTFFSDISVTSYECAVAYILRLVTDLAHYCQESLGETVSVDSVLPFIHKARSVMQVEKRLGLLCGELSERYALKPAGFSQAVEFSLALTEKSYTEASFSIYSVAGQLNITASYFNRVFKKEYGMSYSEHLNLVRLKNARRLLAETELSISDICTSSGFANISYFYTLFKKKYGMTPIEYREYHRE